jgi:hypothetical protein
MDRRALGSSQGRGQSGGLRVSTGTARTLYVSDWKSSWAVQGRGQKVAKSQIGRLGEMREVVELSVVCGKVDRRFYMRE